MFLKETCDLFNLGQFGWDHFNPNDCINFDHIRVGGAHSTYQTPEYNLGSNFFIFLFFRTFNDMMSRTLRSGYDDMMSRLNNN